MKKQFSLIMSSIMFVLLPLVDDFDSNPRKHASIPDKTSITVSAVGDVTLGRDETFPYEQSFNDTADKNGFNYFSRHIKKIFKHDDFTMANLETTLTDATVKADKKFRFKAPPEYVDILTLSGINAVNLANNHSHDYLQQGFDDTIIHLKQQGIGYFGYDHAYITEVKGVRIGALGYEGWEETADLKAKLGKSIAMLREKDVHIVIVHFHWGVERSYYPNDVQKALGRFAIDQGADLVLGHHPHVIQGIEAYNGKFIVYSLGNFMFGGNKNPADKDTMIFQQTFYLENNQLTDIQDISIIPASISSVTNRNNYQPLPLHGEEAARVIAKFKGYTDAIATFDWEGMQITFLPRTPIDPRARRYVFD